MLEARVRGQVPGTVTGRRGCRFLRVEGSEVAPALDPAVVEFIHGGVAVGVATRDDDLRREVARAWGPGVWADGRSRAQCLAYLVGNPRLLDVRCRTIEQLRMANARCRAAEMAEGRPASVRQA